MISFGFVQEVVRGFIWGHYQEIVSPAYPIKDGTAWFDDLGPGLGVELRPEFLKNAGRRISELPKQPPNAFRDRPV